MPRISDEPMVRMRGYGQDTAGERDDPAGELQPRPGEVQDADDDARGGTGGDKPHGLLGPIRETRHKLLGREPGALRRNVQRIVE